MAKNQKISQWLSFFVIVLFATGARISSRFQTESGIAVSPSIAPAGEVWQIGTKYACIQKWRSRRAGFVDKYCLVNMDKAAQTAHAHLQFADDISSCSASAASQHKMKLCSLKGTAISRLKGEARISYSGRSRVPKACFGYSTKSLSSEPSQTFLESVVDEEACKKIMRYPVSQQGTFGKPITTTMTTSTTVEVALKTSCDCEKDGFVGYRLGAGECQCTPAPCGIIGTVNDGINCKCMPGLIGDISWRGTVPSGECMVDATSVFTEGDDSFWNYKGMKIKCCVSTAHGPTELQDLHAEVLPAVGSKGRSNPAGCGYMFGDHYHNGMKPYRSRTDPTCPVHVTKVMAVTGASFAEVKDLFALDKFARSSSLF